MVWSYVLLHLGAGDSGSFLPCLQWKNFCTVWFCPWWTGCEWGDYSQGLLCYKTAGCCAPLVCRYFPSKAFSKIFIHPKEVQNLLHLLILYTCYFRTPCKYWLFLSCTELQVSLPWSPTLALQTPLKYFALYLQTFATLLLS